MKQSKKKNINMMVERAFEFDGDVKSTELKHIEKQHLKRVYDLLVSLEEESSSDEESLEKKYRKEIESKANLKKMDVEIYARGNVKFKRKPGMRKKTQFDMPVVIENKITSISLIPEEDAEREVKLTTKSLRKILRKLMTIANFAKREDHNKLSELKTKELLKIAEIEKVKLFDDEEIRKMIWEVDEDADGSISKYEFEKLYKRGLTDKEELEPKRFYHLIQFLMYDKDFKYFLREEDVLELLYIRREVDFNKAIDEIFKINGNDSENKIHHEKIFFDQYFKEMRKISQMKRADARDRKVNYCEYIDEFKEKK